jgi:hypothetical protein
VGEPGSAFQLANDWEERAVSVLRGAEIAQTDVRLGSEAFQQCGGQSRLSDAGFARQQHDLTLAALCFRPAAQKDFEFFFSPNKIQLRRLHAGPQSGFLPTPLAEPPRRAPTLQCP